MSALPSFSPPGAAVYSSSSLQVGDGTWDHGRNTFLLPNIQGLPFDVMRYNGMGNRFAALPQYHSLITGHGVLAAITFLLVVPAAIFMARFYHIDPASALRMHITLQVFTVIFTTVIFVLGYFAVGPERTLTNPHHGIGLAIYVLVLIQVIGGSIIHRMEKGKTRYFIPMKLMLHQWLGRALALLAFAQIPIGLTLYGSPVWLFILYTLWMAFLVVLYFILTFRSYKREAGAISGTLSYGTRTELSGGTRRNRGALKALTGGILGGAGIYALRRRLSGRHQRSESQGPILAPGEQIHAGSGPVAGEKFTDYSDSSPPRHKWQDRILGGVAGISAFDGIRRFSERFDKQRQADQGSDVDSYIPPPARRHDPIQREQQSSQSAEYMNRMEAGMPSGEDAHWRRVDMQQAAYQTHAFGAARPDVNSQISYDTDRTETKSRFIGPFGIPLALPTLGVTSWFRKRRERREQERIDGERQHDEQERLYGPQLGQASTYTGDGTPMRGAPQRPPADTLIDRSGSPSRYPPSRSRLQDSPYPVAPSVTVNQGFGPPVPNPPPQNIPPPPTLTTNIPPTPPIHRDFSGSSGPLPTREPQAPQSYITESNVAAEGSGRMPQSLAGRNLAPPAPPGHSQTVSGTSNDVESPPVSVRVKMHNDGRYVTLQRLPPEEAAARERYKNVQRQQVNPGGSGLTTETRRSGRYGNLGTAPHPGSPEPGQIGRGYPGQAASALGPRFGGSGELDVPSAGLPPFTKPFGVTAQSAGLDSSQGGTGLQSSEVSTNKPDENRRRRRAERARAAQARDGVRDTRSVDFT